MIRNTTRGTILATREEWARDPASRARGLLGRTCLEDGEALILSPCNSIHMFLMKFAIDVVFVAEDGRVIRTIEALKPWRFTRIHFGARHTIELPVGVVASTGTTRGDMLSLSDNPPKDP